MTAFADSMLPACRQILGEDSPLEVLSFAEVVRSFLVVCGEEALPLAQSGHKEAALAYSVRGLESDSPFYRCRDFPGFHEALMRTLEELHLWGVDAAEMKELARGAEPRLMRKLNDLAEIDLAVAEVLERLGRHQHSQHIRGCLDSVMEVEGDQSRILVLAGAEECPLRVDWLRWASRQGIDVTIAFDRHASDANIFRGATAMIDQLGVKPGTIGPVNQLLRNLFTDRSEPDEAVRVTKVSAADPLAEVEWALRGSASAARPDRTGIYVRDLESYAPLIEAAAKRLAIPIRMTRRAPLLTNSFARLTLSAIQFSASNDVRSLATVLRSSYLRLSGPNQNELGTQLRTCYAQKQAQWETLENWAKEHTESHEWLVAILDWRRKAANSGWSLPEWFGLLQEFNRDQRLPWARLENKGGLMDERDRRALNQMERLLANHISVDNVTEPSKTSLEGFARLCERIWRSGDVSIPTAEEGIRVASDPALFGDIERIHVLGMLEGVFPRRRSEDPILTDAERHAISALRSFAPKLADSESKAQKERDEFYRVCAAGKSEIVFSYPLADDQRDNIPAFYLTEAERAMGGESRIHTHDYPRQELAPLGEESLFDADRRLRQAIEGPTESPLPLELVTEAAKNAVRPPDGSPFMPHMLRDALQCPFLYLVRYRLNLRVKRQSERWGSLRKLPQSAQLLSKQDLADAEHALQGALESELDLLYADVPDWEMNLLRAGGQRLIRDWLRREERSREKWTKDAGSLKQSVAFGGEYTKNVMPGGVKLEGTLAGISRLGGYNVAHIYGSTNADPKSMTDSDRLYLGLHLLAVHEPGRDGAIEMETTGSKRSLVILGRNASRELASSAVDGLQVVDLATADDLSEAKKQFYDQVKKSLRTAVQTIMEGRVEATRGEHCAWCDYGELCRRSQGFGEDDSPFALEEEEA